MFTVKDTLTEGQIKKYISYGGAYCPYCESEEITGHSFDLDGDGVMSQYVYCSRCNQSWSDKYKLIGIEEEGAL